MRSSDPKPEVATTGRSSAARVALLLLGLALGAGALDLALPGRQEGRRLLRPRVVLLGVDGGTWSVLDPLLAAGQLPHLARLRDRGVTAELASVPPYDSPTVWTSIATGRRPEVHGVTSFFATADFVRVATVWERLAARGRRVGLYDYLITWAPRPLPGGFVIPGWTRRDGAVFPADAFVRAGVTPYVYSVARPSRPGEIVALGWRELAEKPRRFLRLAEAFEVELGAVTLYACDLVSHRFWHAAYPEQFPGSPPADPRFRGALAETARRLDRAVGEIAGALGPRTALLLASDHGFRARPDGVRRKWSLHGRALLDLAGIDPARDGVAIVSDWQELVLALRRGSPERLARVEKALAGVRGPAGEPLFEVSAAAGPREAFALPAAFRELAGREPAQAFLLARPDPGLLGRLWPGGTVRIAGARVPLSRIAHPEDFSGAHDPTGIFLAAGGPVRHLPARGKVSVLDLAPLLFNLLGEPIPDDLEGRLPEEILDPAFLRAHPPRHAPAGDDLPRLRPAAPAENPELRERLRSLGYLE